MGIFDKIFGKKNKETEVKDIGIEKEEVKKINAGLNTPNKIYLENSEVHIKRGEEALARNDLEKALLEFKYAVIYSSCQGHPPNEINEIAVNYLRGEKLSSLNVKRTTKAQSLFDEGCASLEKRDYNKAITLFNKAINLCPIAAVASFVFQGKALLMAGRYQEAIDDFSIALQYTPNVAECYFDRGQAYLKVGNSTAARKDFQIAIKLNPQYEEAKKMLQEEEEETKEQEDIVVDHDDNAKELLKKMEEEELPTKTVVPSINFESLDSFKELIREHYNLAHSEYEGTIEANTLLQIFKQIEDRISLYCSMIDTFAHRSVFEILVFPKNQFGSNMRFLGLATFNPGCLSKYLQEYNLSQDDIGLVSGQIMSRFSFGMHFDSSQNKEWVEDECKHVSVDELDSLIEERKADLGLEVKKKGGS